MNAAQSLVDYAVARIPRVIAAPLQHFTQLSAMTPGMHGYVTDALGYLNRPGGAAQRSVSSIAAAVTSGRRGAGWRRISGTASQVVTTDGLVLRDAGGTAAYHFGDLSGDAAASGSITMTVVLPTLPSVLGDRFGLRVLAPEETGTGSDADTKGYVLGLRATGQLHMWSSPAGAYGGGTALGTAPTGPALIAGTPYTLLFEWTATQVRLTRVDTGATTGWVSDSLWRGRNIYTVSTLGSPAVARITALFIA